MYEYPVCLLGYLRKLAVRRIVKNLLTFLNNLAS